MVYCVKCGAKNPDDARVCTQCGAPLYVTGEQPRREGRECFGTRRAEEPYRRVEDECFGLPGGRHVGNLVFGLIILLFGASLLINEIYHISINWWPWIIVIFGLLIVAGALYGMFRRR